MLKKNSAAWQLAKQYERLKFALSFRAIELSDCGEVVTFQAMIRGNTFKLNRAEISAMIQRTKARQPIKGI